MKRKQLLTKTVLPGVLLASLILLAVLLMSFTGCQRPDDAYDLRFGVIADTHIGYAGRGANPESLDYSMHDRLAKALQWYNTQDVSMLAIVGDLTQNGIQSEWDVLRETLHIYTGSLEILPVMGNHDADSGTDSGARERFEAASGRKANAHYVINGYHFIALSGGWGNIYETGPADGAIATAHADQLGWHQWQSVSDPLLVWLRTRIDYAKEQAPGKPIFIFLHWPVQNTFYVSDIWYTSNFGDDPYTGFFNNDPEVVIFGGHIHSPNNDPRSIWQGGFTAVNVPSINYMEMERGYLGDSQDGITNRPFPKICTTATGQGLIVSVKGSMVTITNYDFDMCSGARDLSDVTRIPQTWIFDAGNPANFPYTNARRHMQKTAPVFDAGAASSAAIDGMISIRNIQDTAIEVEFIQALIPAPNPGSEVVHSYRFDFINTQTGEVEVSRKQWSDFMVTPRLRQTMYTQLLGGLIPATEYELRIYAFGSFQEESTQYLVNTFTLY